MKNEFLEKGFTQILEISFNNELLALQKLIYENTKDNLINHDSNLKIEDKLNPSDTAPLPYIEPTIKQVILNKRKLELIKKIEKDITTDAIKNNNFEIYEDE